MVRFGASTSESTTGIFANLPVFSCHLSDLTQRLATVRVATASYRDSFRRRSPTSTSPGVSIALPAPFVVRTCAGNRKVEIYDMFDRPGTNTPPTGFVAMTYATYTVRTVCFVLLVLVTYGEK